VEFRVLGPLELTSGGQPLALGGARTRAVLAMLLVSANRVVPADRIADELWPGRARDRAAANLQVRLSELRRALKSVGEETRLVTRPPGYLLRVADGELDLLRFESLAAAGREALASGDAPAAARLLAESLALWRGPALADLHDLPFAATERARLEEDRLGAVEAKLDAQLASGRQHEILAELEALTAAHPLRERFWAQRLLALYRSRRQADALRAYRELRTALVDQLGIEPGPELRDLEARILRQDRALDHQIPHQAASGGWAQPETRYADSDGTHIAYQVLGAGPLDIVAVPGLVSHLDLWWQDRTATRFFRRLAGLGRLIMFDKRDTGLSDTAPGDLSLEQRMADVQAVMRACGSSRAVLFGYSEGGPMCLLFAATYPERVSALVLAAAAARWLPAPGYPCGDQSYAMLEAFERLASRGWGQGESIEWYAPSRAGSARVRQELARWERMAVSPGALLRIIRLCRSIDVRDVLPAIRVPALVIQRAGDRITPPFHGRYLADHIREARYFEQPGDHLLWLGDTDAMVAEIERFLTEAEHPPGPGRLAEPDCLLTTILCVEALSPHAADDGGWAATMARHVQARRGHVIKNTGRRIVATFDGPARAIRCAATGRDTAAGLGIEVRAGVHTGEVEILGHDVAGVCVGMAEDLAGLARPAEILVTRTVRDLVAGSGIAFTDRGSRRVGAAPGRWRLFAVTGP
jgi:DNA-binding SARP family transcriptional activator/pimeloyl-ACP methyl ester carboxylesterase